MKLTIICILLLAGCTPPKLLANTSCPPPGLLGEPAGPSGRGRMQVAAVVPQPGSVIDVYAAQRKKEVDAVSDPNATAQSVHSIIAADRRAREALMALGREGNKPKAATLTAARLAVDDLSAVLSQTPDVP